MLAHDLHSGLIEPARFWRPPKRDRNAAQACGSQGRVQLKAFRLAPAFDLSELGNESRAGLYCSLQARPAHARLDQGQSLPERRRAAFSKAVGLLPSRL